MTPVDRITVVVADYTASNAESFLAYLDALSAKRCDGGMLHGGHIHYIQEKMGNETGFTLKAAISAVLDRVPTIFPLDLPDIIAKDPNFEPTEAMQRALEEINAGLLIPVDGYEIVEIIQYARDYAAMEDIAQ